MSSKEFIEGLDYIEHQCKIGINVTKSKKHLRRYERIREKAKELKEFQLTSKRKK